jgi:sugar transferase (PEP-CTERM/EpsH1 system associated)
VTAAGAGDAPRLVVHVVHRFAVGGLENGVVNLINQLPPERWSHAVIALTEVDEAFARRIRRDDVRFVSLHKPPGQGLWLYGRLYRLLREWRPAIVHTRNLGTLEFQLPAWAARVPGRVHGEHGRDADDVHGTNRRHIALRRLYKPFVMHQIALGSELAGYLRDKVGVAPAALSMICNGVDHLRFAPAAGGRAPIAGCPFSSSAHWLVGTVGRMQHVKAQTVLVQAFIRVLREQPAWRERLRLVLVGDGPLRAECRQLLEAAGCAELAWLPGERADVPDVMRGLDCFVLPSRVEGISNTILEAMASGLPVLATDVGGNRDLITLGVTGEIVPADDVPALARGLAALAADPERAAAMGRAGRAAVERRFSLPAMVAAYEGVYERVLRTRHHEHQGVI